MFNQGDIVLIDTNVIIEAHRVGCWDALADFYNLHTVAKVVEETQTGQQNRDVEQNIDQQKLQKSFKKIVTIGQLEVAQFDLNYSNTEGLDDGEKHLIIYGLTLKVNVWFLNSPDLAAVKFCHQEGLGDKVVSLSEMALCIRANYKQDLKMQFTEAWLSSKKTNLHLGVL